MSWIISHNISSGHKCWYSSLCGDSVISSLLILPMMQLNRYCMHYSGILCSFTEHKFFFTELYCFTRTFTPQSCPVQPLLSVGCEITTFLSVGHWGHPYKGIKETMTSWSLHASLNFESAAMTQSLVIASTLALFVLYEIIYIHWKN